MNPVSSALTALIIAPIRWYQRLISPMRPPTCRFYPSCSAYAVKALQVHGPFVGLWLAVRRLGRCHPWASGGVDHVPPAGRWRQVRPPYDPGEGEVGTRDGGPDHVAESGPGTDDDSDEGSTATRSCGVQSNASSLSLPAPARSSRTRWPAFMNRGALRRTTFVPGA